jgi:hypothetical protein
VPEINAKLQKYIDSIPWVPQKGPQEDAMFSPADVVLYGGAAGGGKTALACGMAITRHDQALIMRREATQMKGIIKEISSIIDPKRDGYSKQDKEWVIPAWDGRTRFIMFGSCPNLGDEDKWQGIPRDLLVLDEAANFLGSQAMFLMGWTRSTELFDQGVPGQYARQRTRVLLCSNPPTNSDGMWLYEMFGAWLDPHHPKYPTPPGELRYYTTVAGIMEEQPNGDPVLNPSPTDEHDKWIYPKSFTFIPARVHDNKYLDSEYLRELQALPEPLRSQMLLGDFTAGRVDGEWQIIPSEWVEIAMARWEPREFISHNITSTGVDVSRGGKDDTVIAMREDWYYHELKVYPGHQMKTGGDVCAKILTLVGDSMCPVHVDAIGPGGSVVDQLESAIETRTVPVNVAAGCKGATDWSGIFNFINIRAKLWWQFRDLLNPANGRKVALPRNQRLKSELCAPRYWLQANGIKVESKEDIIKRLGRSTDYADAVLLAAERTPIATSNGDFRPPPRSKRST